MEVAKWIEFGGILSSFVGKAIQELAPQLRDWSERYRDSDGGPEEPSEEELVQLRYRRGELLARPVLTQQESGELQQIDALLSRSAAVPPVQAVQPAGFPPAAGAPFVPRAAPAAPYATPEQLAQIDSLRRQGLIP